MQDFNAKQNALFACLDDASKELKGTGLDQSHMPNYAKLALERRLDGTVQQAENNSTYLCERQSVDSSLKRMRGKESLFKKPELPIGRCLKPRKTPDYQINPHKWKKYSLADVDISDQTNTAAAFAFLKQMEEQRDGAVDGDREHNDDQKIEFKKSSKIKRSLNNRELTAVPDAEVDKPKLKGSKLVMPEYVIGQKSHKDTKRNKSKEKQDVARAAGILKLSHLDDEPEEEEF